MTFWVETNVAKVTHQSGTKYSQRGSYKNPALKEWEAELKRLFAPHIPPEPMTGPLMIHITIVWPYLVSDINTKAKREALEQCPYIWHESKPDWDNASKTIGDMLGVKNGVGIISDDAIIVYGLVRKCRGKRAGILIRMSQISGEPVGVMADVKECIKQMKKVKS